MIDRSRYFSIVTVFAVLFTLGCENQKDEKVWETLTSSGTVSARHENSFVAVGDKFYLLGGRGIKPVNVYDPQTALWTEGASPPIEVHHFQAVAYAGKVYIFGAMTGNYPHETPLKRILIYDPQKDLWEFGDTIPEGRRRGSSGVVINEDQVIIVSGITDGHWAGHVTWVDQYDMINGSWSVLADAPRPRDHFHAALIIKNVF